MKNLLFALIIPLSFTLLSCSDSSTGPNPGNGKNGSTPTYNVSVSKSPSNAGTISPSTDSTYDDGSEISLKADPAEGYKFSYWDGDIDSSSDNPLSLTVDKDYSLQAHFDKKSYQLIVNTEGEGSVDENVIQQKSKEYDYSTVVELTANPAQGWKFVKWKGDLTGTDNPAQITVDNPKSVTAVFEKKNYPLTVNTDGEGAVDEQVIQQKTTDYKFGTEVQLTANPAKGWKFVKWTGDLSGSENPTQITVDTTKKVAAVFEKKSYGLNITTQGEGSVAKDPDQTEYDYQTSVSLQADPDTGYKFVKWQGDIASTDNPVSITVDTTKAIMAVFEIKTFPISLSKTGEGTITKSPNQAEYDYGSSVTLTANPAKGYKFVQWQGDTTTTASEVTFTIKDAKEFTAVFEKKNYSLTTNTSGEGSISASPSQSEYPYNISVELTARPSKGWKFVKWTGDITSTSNPLTLTMDTSKTVTAVFEKKTFTLSVEKMGEGSVTLTPDQAEYEYGTKVELSASASGDWAFNKWDGNISNITNPLTITVDTTKSIIAKFKNTLFAGGYGTEANPYQISTIDQLQAINQYPSAHYIQINDIDASETLNWNGGKGFKPIGDDIVKFKGVFEGNSKKIVNLYINRNTYYIGLFGYIENATLKNINIDKIEVKGDGYVGGLIGYNDSGFIKNVNISGIVTNHTSSNGWINDIGCLIGENTGIVNSSNSDCDVSGGSDMGGLIGTNLGEIKNSSATGKVGEGGVLIGGLVGENKGNVILSYTSGNVSGGSNTGGLVGINRNSAEIISSHSTAQVNSSYTGIGGLVGTNQGIIKKSFAKGEVSGSSEIGGLVGNNYDANSHIINSYSQGNVDGDKMIGGLVGVNQNNATVTATYASGSITGTTDVGGLVGTNGATIISSYWNTESTNQATAVGRGTSDGTTGLTTSEMTGTSAKDNMPDFNWSEIWITTTNYPALFWE